MKLSIRKAVALMGISTMFLSVGCSSSSDVTTSANTTTETTGESETTVTEVAPGKKGTIEFWTVFTGADGQSMQAIVDAYNATNPDYTVNHRAMAEEDLYLKMPLAVQTGQDVPTVVINHIERIPLFIESDFLMDLTDYLPKSEVAAENYNAKVWSMTDVNGGHYAVPLDYHSYITYVNMDLYEKYGNGALDDGYLTWDEIKASADAVVADNLIPIGLDWKGADWRSAYAQLGGTMSDDGVQPSIIDEDSIRVLTQWQELYEAGYTTQEGDSAWSLFLGGQLLYCTEGIWMYNNVKEAGLNAVMTEYPAFSETERGGWTSSHNFVIPKDDSRSEEEVLAALDFINFVGENSLEWAKAGQVPAHKSIIDNEEFQGMQQYFLTQNDDLIKMYDYKYYGYVNEALDKVYKEINYCRMTPEEGLQQAEQEVRDRINAEQ